MLEFPIMQPVNPSAQAESPGRKTSMNSDTPVDAETEFQAEYEDAKPMAEDAEEGIGQEAAVKSEQTGDGEEPRRSAQDTAPVQDESVADPESIAGATESTTRSDKETQIQSAQVSSTTSRRPTTEDIVKPRPTDPQNNTSQDDVPKDAIETGVASVAVPAKQQKPVTAAGTPAENAVLAKVSATKPDAATPVQSAQRTSALPPEPQQTATVTTSQDTAQRPTGSVSTESLGRRVDITGPERRETTKRDTLADLRNTEAPKPSLAKAPQQQLVVQTAASVVQPKISIVKEKAESFLSPMSDLDLAAPFEQRSNGTSGPNQTAPVFTKAETPATIARQMAEALQRAADRPVEISLNPKELGRVRMSISAAEAGITVNVIAERPETLDLMRRNIDQLSREFEGMGYSDIGFAFAEGEARERFEQPDGETPDHSYTFVDLETSDVTELPPEPAKTPATGIDIRL